jgi:hypothetical protein
MVYYWFMDNTNTARVGTPVADVDCEWCGGHGCYGCFNQGCEPTICSDCGADDHEHCTAEMAAPDLGDCAECSDPAIAECADGQPRCDACVADLIADGEMSLTETLAYYGIGHRRTENADVTGCHDIVQDGAIVFTGRAHETWTWLREQGLVGREAA